MKKLLLAVIAVATIWPSLAQQTFNLGGDISMLPQYESVSTPYYNAAGGRVSDVLAFMGNTCKMNSMRVRLFVDPDPAIAKTGVAQDLEYVMKLGKRIKDKNMDFLLDFHYSDNWADPSNQSIPASWKKNTDNDALQDSLYNYTKRCLEYLVANGAKVLHGSVSLISSAVLSRLCVRSHPMPRSSSISRGQAIPTPLWISSTG